MNTISRLLRHDVYHILTFLVLSVCSTVFFFVCASFLNDSMTRIEAYRKEVENYQSNWQFQRKVFWDNVEVPPGSGEDADYTGHSMIEEVNPVFKMPTNETPVAHLPQCIIVGVSKCGTRALLEYLNLHPLVVTVRHELNFFNNDSLYGLGFQWYQKQMPPSFSNQITIEKSPDYFECPSCPSRIRSMNSSIRLLILLRDPVERLVSQYMQFLDKYSNTKYNIGPFDKWIQDPKTRGINTKIPAVHVSDYALHLADWFRSFPRTQIFFLDSGKFSRDPLPQLSLVEKFLGLPPYLGPDDVYRNASRGFPCMRLRRSGKTYCLSQTKGRAHISVDNSTLRMLRDYYRPRNEQLRRLLGLWMSWF